MPNNRVIINPNFKNKGDLERSLMARGKGAKDFPNTHTEVEYLGNGKVGASISVGHRVFFDKADGNKPKKHKLTDERPAKDYVLVQGAKCCVEVHPYYARYFDVQHEEVRLYEERWVVQRLFKEPDTWRDVDAYNPQIAIEEHSEPAGDVVKVTVTYDTDYGELVVEYFQKDGNALKHNISFKNTSPSMETFRVLQRWAGIVADKVNGKDFPLVTDELFLVFRKADGKLAIAENFHSMMFNSDGLKKIDQCLKQPINIEVHAQGMKADFIYGNWILAQNEGLGIDPDTATLDDPAEDGYIRLWNYMRYSVNPTLEIGYDSGEDEMWRSYVEWDVSSILDGATILDTIFKYEGHYHEYPGIDCHIHEMIEHRPSTSTDQEVYDEAGEGTVYADPDGFPVVAVGQEVDLGSDADADLQSQLPSDWFAIGIQSDNETTDGYSNIKSEEAHTPLPDPKPTLYVEYTTVSAPTVTTQAVDGVGFD